MAILFHCPWDNAEEWLAALQAHLPEDDFRIWPNLGRVEDIDFAFVWRLPHGELAKLPNLRGIASLGAGVDALLTDPDLPRDIPISRLVDPVMADRMAEYVTATVLHHHLGLDAYDQQAGHEHWQRHSAADARDRTVALLGLGQMGRRCAQYLQPLGFNLLGWRRHPDTIDGVTCDHGPDGLARVLASAQIAVILLPLTEETTDLMDADAFAAMPRGSYLINCSRGEIVVEEALIAALDYGHLAGATLDAFRTEPLPAGDQMWQHPKVRVTPHIASLSAAHTAAPILAEQVRRARAGEALTDTVEIERGY